MSNNTISENYLGSDILEVEKLSDLLKNKTQLKEFFGYKNLTSLDKKIKHLEDILSFDFVKSFYDEESAKYKIPIISFEIFKVLFSLEEKDYSQNSGEDRDILLLNEMKKNLSNSASTFQRIIYKFILNKWESILKGNFSFDDWKKSITKIDNKLEKEYMRLGNETQIDPKTKRKYLKEFWGFEIFSSRFESHVPNRRYDLVPSNSVEYYFFIESTKYKLTDILRFSAINQLSFDVAYLDKLFSHSHTFFEWLKWLVNKEVDLIKEYNLNIASGIYDEKRKVVRFFELFGYYLPMVMIANQYNIAVSTESRRIREQKLAFEGGNKSRYGTNSGLKMIDFLHICQQEGISTEENELIEGINLGEVDFKSALCKDYFSLQDLCQFFYEHKIVYLPYTNQLQPYEDNGTNNRKKLEFFDKRLEHYSSKIEDNEKIMFSKNMDIETSKIDEYLLELNDSFFIRNFREEEIRTKLEQELARSESPIEEKNKDIYLDRYDKYRLGLYLLDLAVVNSEVDYLEWLGKQESKRKTVDPEMNPQVSKNWNYVLKMIDRELESGKHLVEIVREMRSY